MLHRKSSRLICSAAPMMGERRHTDGWKFPAVILSVLGLCSWAGIAQAEDCWQSEFTKKTYTWQEFSSVTAGSQVTTPSGKSLTDARAPRAEWIKVGGPNEFTKFYRVPCPPPPPTAPGGLYVQAGIGGGWSVPSSPGLPHGSGSGVTGDASVGFRFSSRDLTSWGSLDAGVTWFGHGESFPAPADDLKVRPTVVFHQSASLGPNFQGFAPGQRIAPYLELGIAESPIKVSALVGSDTRWSVAP
jgi:hypothetical protein